MDETVVVMVKNKETNFLEKELAQYTIQEQEAYISRIFATEEEEGIFIDLWLSCGRDVEDWEFGAIYDSYDVEEILPLVLAVEEVEDTFNPTWRFVFPFSEDTVTMENKVQKILQWHHEQLQSVFAEIKDKKDAYIDEEDSR